MRFAAVYASIRVISETKGCLPIKVYEISDTGIESETKQHPVAELLAVEPNADQTPMVYQEHQQSQVLSRGNSYAEIVFDGAGNPIELIPIHPTNLQIGRDKETRRIMYRVTDDEGFARELDQSQVMHIPGLGGDGIVGWSPIRLAAESIGIGLANERFAGKYFGEFARPSMIIESEGEIGDAYDELQNSLANNYSGDNVGSALLLEGGLKAKTVSIPLNECQFLESREFQGKEIACRWYRIPAQIAGYSDDAKYDHMEQADLFFAKYTLGPWCTRDEQEARRKLFPRGQRLRYRIKHNMDALVRADIKTRYESHQMAIMSGWKTINEVRKLEDLNPVEGGDELTKPESVFGKQDKPAADDSRSDPRLALLVKQAVDGLQSRELTAIERYSGKSDRSAKIEAFYDKHKTLVNERFGDIASESGMRELNAIIEEHRQEAKATPHYQLKWTDDAERIASIILEPSTVAECKT
jgi:HK97 family phage portal protein